MTEENKADRHRLVKISLSEAQNAQSDDAEVAGKELEDTTNGEPELAEALASCNGDNCALARYMEIAHTVDACAVNGCQSLLT
jgi:hypothetical protein